MKTFSGIHDTLWYANAMAAPGSAVEFGVASGQSLRVLAENRKVTGFDSFEGLPEDWRPRFPKGKFACDVPDVPNAEIVIGLFEDTLPNWTQPNDLSLIHIDCDLYSSTSTVLSHLTLKPGMIVVFDEYHGYPGWEDHEHRAWAEYTKREGISWTPIAQGPEQLAVRID